MAKEGLTERLIRVMLSAAATPQPGNTQATGAAATTSIMPTAMIGPPMEFANRKRNLKQNEGAMAIASQAPYYRTSSIFWGFWKKKTGVGVGVRSDQMIGAQLGAAYGQVRWMSPTGVPAGYVVLP